LTWLGLTNEQIGHVLGVSANTIKGTLARAFRKLGIESRAEPVATLFDGLWRLAVARSHRLARRDPQGVPRA